MAASVIREWTGIQQFPPATQTKLLELLGKLKQENLDSLTILLLGKGGVGKSSTVNSIVGERAVAVNAFQSEGPRPVMVSRSRAGFTLNIIDTPGLVEGGYVNDQALDLIKRFLLGKTIDVLLYVDRLDTYRVDNLDKQIVKAISDSFGKAIWSRAIVVLTHAQLSPPDCLSYEEFFSRRSGALLKVIDQTQKLLIPILNIDPMSAVQWKKAVAAFPWNNPMAALPWKRPMAELPWKKEIEDSTIPVALVENSGRCNKNESDEKILPNGTAWIPNLVQTITEIVLKGESKGIRVDQKLIDGPNANNRGKLFIPLILCFQYFFVVKRIQSSIEKDVGGKKIDEAAPKEKKFLK